MRSWRFWEIQTDPLPAAGRAFAPLPDEIPDYLPRRILPDKRNCLYRLGFVLEG